MIVMPIHACAISAGNSTGILQIFSCSFPPVLRILPYSLLKNEEDFKLFSL
jgi:hypothetical protein